MIRDILNIIFYSDILFRISRINCLFEVKLFIVETGLLRDRPYSNRHITNSSC